MPADPPEPKSHLIEREDILCKTNAKAPITTTSVALVTCGRCLQILKTRSTGHAASNDRPGRPMCSTTVVDPRIVDPDLVDCSVCQEILMAGGAPMSGLKDGRIDDVSVRTAALALVRYAYANPEMRLWFGLGEKIRDLKEALDV